jgi:nucleoside-diphosphate-sugar epimerase
MAAESSVIVFGGSGFIGRHLLSSLVRGGRRVISADIQPLQPAIPGVESVICDVRRQIPLNLLPGSPDMPAGVVYNLAAVHRTPGHEAREYYDTNVSGALNVTDYCRRLGVRRVVFTSSISVYGPGEEAKEEGTLPAPESPYGCSKLQAERIHANWQVEDSSRRLVIVRPAVVFGPGEAGNFTRLAQALRGRRFVYPGRRDTIKSCGYVDELLGTMDFARALDRAIFLYNFCYAQSYTIQDICEAFHEVAGLPLPWGTLPYAAMRLAAQPFEFLAMLGLETGIHRERIDKLVRSTCIRPRALIDAGYGFTTNLKTALLQWRDASGGEFA